MIPLAFVLSVITGIYIGYRHKTLEDTVKMVAEAVEKRRKKEEEKPDSVIIDPDDALLMARLEQEKKMKLLNPDE